MSKFAGAKRMLSTTVAHHRLRRLGVCVGEGVVFHGQPIATLSPHGVIKIGDRAVLTSVSEATALGVRSPVILRCMTADAVIEIGEDCGLSGTVVCAAISVTIGQRCLFGADCMIFDTDFHNLAPRKPALFIPRVAKNQRACCD